MKRAILLASSLFLFATTNVVSAAGPIHSPIQLMPPQQAARSAGKVDLNEPGGKGKIYDSIGKKYPKAIYNALSGNEISGTDNPLGIPQFYEAAAFTAKKNQTARKIEIGIGHDSGTNAYTISLNSDAGGVPGSVLEQWNVSDVPIFGTCCDLVTVSDSNGIPLTGGSQYWIVVQPQASDTFGYFLINGIDLVDQSLVAYYCVDDVNGGCGSVNHQWFALPSYGIAFAVLGK